MRGLTLPRPTAGRVGSASAWGEGRERPSVSERLKDPEAVLTRSDLAELGYARRAIDVIVKHVMQEGSGVQVLPLVTAPR